MNRNYIKNGIFFLLLTSISTAFAAGAKGSTEQKWKSFWHTEDGEVAYFDSNTVQKLSDGIAFMVMHDFKKPMSFTSINSIAYSTTMQALVNCNDRTVTLLKVSVFTGHKATGKALIKNVNQQGSASIEPNTEYDSWYKTVCTR